MNKRAKDLLVVAGCTLAISLVIGHAVLRVVDGPQVDPAAAEHVRATRVPDPVLFDSAPPPDFWARLGEDIGVVSEALVDPARREELRALADGLLGHAAEAVAERDDERLGASLALLGQVAIEEQDFDAAEVYLAEALDVFERLGDNLGTAKVHMHLGRMHLKLRQRARTAGQAYDRLLLARWQLTRGQLGAAEDNLRLVVDENLSINRFGAAASALNTLRRLHVSAGEFELAEHAAAEAAGLYAASGQLGSARSLLHELERAGMPEGFVRDLESDIERRYTAFEESVSQLQQAQDYSRLYSHFRSQGDDARAWRLRLRANESLRKVPRREMYHRIPDVLALLYVSNENRDQARSYLERARRVFDLEGLDTLVDEAQRLEIEIL